MKSLKFALAASLLLTTGISFAGCLQPPIPGTIITSNFGMRFHPKFKTWRPHNGTDMRAGMYTKVNAANSGQVTFSGYMGGGGNVVMILGDDGIQTRYLHLSKAGVAIGQRVSAGEPIALSGNTGHASAAPHLHFEARPNGGAQVTDPRTLLCQSLAEKSDSGPDKTAEGQPAPGSSAPASQAQDGPAFVATSLNGYEGMAEMDMLRIEAERRFMNPDWHTRLAGCGRDMNQSEIDGKEHQGQDCTTYLRRELLEVTALANYIEYKKHLSLERMAAIQANRAVDRSKGVSEQKLEALSKRARAMNSSK